jgi:spermidine synthase
MLIAEVEKMFEPGAIRRPWRAWEAYLLVFATSLCTLVLEIVAGRVLAPAIGVSLYTWTSIIGIVLAGLAVGNYLGGVAARRIASPGALAALLLASSFSVWVVAILSRTNDFERVFTELEPLTRIVWLSGLLFFPPSLLMGTVTPLVAQLTLLDRAESGAVVGRLGAVSAAGSIAGTFLAGFYLIPVFGSRAILLAVAVALLLLALLTLAGRTRFSRLGATIVFVSATLIGAPTGYALTQDRNACLLETAYSCIRINWSTVGEVIYGTVQHDRVVQGHTAPHVPRLLLLDYVRAFADAAVYQQERPVPVLASTGPNVPQSIPPLRVLFVGGGSYTLPRYLEAVYPGSDLHVLEIDPEVTATAQRYLGLRLDGAIRVQHGDARPSLSGLPGSAYDLVYGDAFSDISIPWHLTTLEFAHHVRRVLRPDGLYVANVIDTWEDSRFLAAFVRTLGSAFSHVSLLRVTDWHLDGLQNWVVVASDQPLDAVRLELIRRPGLTGTERAQARLVEPDRVAQWLSERRHTAPVLTDDYAPVDRLLSHQTLWR